MRIWCRFATFWPFFLILIAIIINRRPLFILENCIPKKEGNYRCYPVCYICNKNISLHLPYIWYFFHRWWNLCPFINKRQMCPLLSCHYSVSFLFPNVCLMWMWQTLNIILLVKCCSFTWKYDKKITELHFFVFLLCTFLPFCSEWVHKRYVKIT